MAIPGATSALVAAFSFGIVFNAALAALFLVLRGHGSSAFRDGKRLVLILFLLSAGVWAQGDFITTLIDPSAAGSCQVGVIITTIFDQLARYTIEQHVLWLICTGTPSTVAHYFATALLAGRFVLGAVFVGLAKSEFNTVCVPVTSNLIIGVVVVGVDGLIVATLFARAISTGTFKKMQDGGQDSARGKTVIAILIGFSLWTATSVPMLLGIAGGEYIFRSALPAGGLGVLITIVTAVTDLTPDAKRDRERRMPEAPSPRLVTATSRDISTADSTDYPPSRYEDIKRENVTSVSAFVQPREVPLPGQAPDLASISGPGPAGPGIGGMAVTGQLFPPMRAESDIQRSVSVQQQERQKKSVFGSNKAPAGSITVGKLAISNPVLAEGGSNPLDKLATTDLATAAQMDKERRAERLRLLEQSAPGPRMGQSMVDEMQKETVEVTTILPRGVTSPVPVSEPSLPESATLAVGSASGWQSSPSGKDELRRRSPRRMASNASEKSSMTQTSLSIKSSESSLSSEVPSPPAKSPARILAMQATNQSGPGVVANIRPSRQRATTPEPVAEPAKTPIQRMATAGLPLNPRARSVRKKAEQVGRQETVMFVNSIVYDDPDYVESVLGGAKAQAPKTAPLPVLSTSIPSPGLDSFPPKTPFMDTIASAEPGNHRSVVHRPRPVPRKPTEDDQSFYPPTNNTGHRKSRSAGSILRSQPGSPTQLPPLPMPPLKPSAFRKQPNDTKSMTFDEKVKYLFPPPQMPEKPSKRRSSNPELPRSFMSDSPTLTDGYTQSSHSRDSKRTESSVRTRSIFEDQEEPSLPREVSMGTYQGLCENGEEYGLDLDEQALNEGTMMSRNTGGKRASSPILPMMMDFKSPVMSAYDDDNTTNMESIHSPLPIQQVGITMMQARAVEVGRPNDLHVPTQAQPPRGVSTATTGEEFPFMLDSAVAHEFQESDSKAADVESSPETAFKSRSRGSSASSTGPIQSHHIGDETPSFSLFSEKRRSRRGPPPTPLILSDRPTSAKQAAMAHAAELSPLPSPDEALKMIQAQLKKYEEPNRSGSMESPGRLALLNDLEMEMGMQETRWMNMQSALARGSISTIDVSPTSRHVSAAFESMTPAQSLSRNSSIRSNLNAELENSRRSRLASVASLVSNGLANGEPGTRATLWQKRLAEAQMEYMENAREHTRKRSMNFLTAPKSATTPTPPESESEYQIESRKNFAAFLEKSRSERSTSISGGLWVPPPAPEKRDGLMWVRPERPYHVYVAEPPLPGLSVRPAPRKESSELPITSTSLWQKPAAMPSNDSGLWKSAAQLEELNKPKSVSNTRPSFYNPSIQRSRSNPSRPVTQRPPRRSKRITALPDILEDPQPLPNKRGTLGIFQFPWGEKSDTATVALPGPAARPFAAMPGTMSTGASLIKSNLNARSRQLEEEEYSSSFFDDYEDDASDNSSDMGSDDDEGFDESTLFEIASLLKSSNVPSTDSFFGPSSSRDAAGDFIANYLDDDEDRDEEARRDDRQTILVGIEEEFEALQEMRPTARGTSSLWEIPEQEDESAKGLPQPENWEDEYDQVMDTFRAKPRLSVQTPTISSDNLWKATTPKVPSDRSPLWTPLSSPKRVSLSSSSEAAASPSTTTMSSSDAEQGAFSAITPTQPLWVPTEQKSVGDHGVGLPHPQDWASYDTVKSTVRAKPRQSEPAAIESVNMWQVPSVSNDEALESAAPPKQVAPLMTENAASGPELLWEPSEEHVKGDHGVGLPHPIEWESYDAVKSTIRAKPRQQTEPAVIESADLWQVPAASAQEVSWLQVETTSTPALVARSIESEPLWEKIEEHVQSDHGVGLPQPIDWSNFEIIESPRKAKARQQLEPAVIESVDLWRVSEPEAPYASALMWSPTRKVASPEPKPAQLPAKSFVPEVVRYEEIQTQIQTTTGAMLWSPTLQSEEKMDSGMFDINAGRTQFRTTDQSPAALDMQHQRRSPEPKPLDRLASQELWTVEAQAPEEHNWIMSKVASSTGDKTLWSAPVSFEDSSDTGLFDSNAGRAQFRTTDQPPAALDMDHQRRSPELKPLDRLASQELWAVEAQAPEERNWIMSNVVSPTSDKTLWSAPVSFEEASDEGLFDLNAKRADFRTTSKAPAALEASRKSRKAEDKALEPLFSTALWTAAPQGQTERNWIASPTSVNIERRILSMSKKNWELALEEAVTASYPKQRKSTRVPVATPEQWTEALEQAVSASYPRGRATPLQAATSADWAAALADAVHKSYPTFTSIAFDAARRHPVFAEASSLVSKASIVHPAAVGYVYDVTVRHPVFAASSLTTKSKIFHPAATGYTHDAAVRHPVFAASSLTTKSKIFHPAATGYTHDAAVRHPVFAASSLNTKSKVFHPAAVGYVYDVTVSHPVFAASSLTTKTEVYHPAAEGYTHDVAIMHPVFFGSGAGKHVHPAIPSHSETDASDAWLLAATVEIAAREAQSSHSGPSGLQRNVSVNRGKGSRISKMLSRFQPDGASSTSSPSSSPSVSRSSSRGSIADVFGAGRRPSVAIRQDSESDKSNVSSRGVGAPLELRGRMQEKVVMAMPSFPVVEPVRYGALVEIVPAEKTAPLVEPVVERIEPAAEFVAEPVAIAEPVVEQTEPEFFLPQTTYQDPAILAQIEALEQERLFAQQWASNAEAESTPAALSADETIFLPSTPPSEQAEYPVYSYNHTTDHLAAAEQLITPTSSQATEEHEEQEVIIPENASFFNFSAAPTSGSSSSEMRPGRILSIITSEPLFEAAAASSQFSSSPSTYSARSGSAEAMAAELITPTTAEERNSGRVAQLRRQDSVRSVVSPLSEYGHGEMRESMVSLNDDGESGSKGKGSRMDFTR